MGLSSLSDITISLSVLLTSLIDVIPALVSWVRSYRTECNHPLYGTVCWYSSLGVGSGGAGDPPRRVEDADNI